MNIAINAATAIATAIIMVNTVWFAVNSIHSFTLVVAFNLLPLKKDSLKLAPANTAVTINQTV
jgi:hypothetical protein